MFEKLRALFDPKMPRNLLNVPEGILLVVSTDETRRPEPASQEIRESILSLKFHPGFQWLVSKKRFQRAVLEAKLKTEKHADIREVDLLQAMIAALQWDEQQVDFEVGRIKPQKTEAKPYEQELFEKISQSIDLIQ